MTVSYTEQLGVTHVWTAFLILCRWKGSVFKLVLKELIAFLVIYTCVSATYKIILVDRHPRIRLAFQFMVFYCAEVMNRIPIAFVLGFYISTVVNWWFEQFNALPWPDDFALQLSAFIQGNTAELVILRRTIVRYANLGMIIALRGISVSLEKKFPTFESMVVAGLMTEDENLSLESVDKSYNKYYVPLVWAGNLIREARRENIILNDRQLDVLIETLSIFRGNLGNLFVHQWINPPLVYTQVATITVYCYFFAAIMAWQYIEEENDYYVPLFGILQFLLYIGWLKVAENLINPFGEKDDDFDMGFIVERNVQIAYMIVDDIYNEYPVIIEDDIWNKNG